MSMSKGLRTIASTCSGAIFATYSSVMAVTTMNLGRSGDPLSFSMTS